MEPVRYFNDYMGRPIALFKQHFDELIKDADKRSMLDSLEALFGDPDEAYWEKVSDEPEVFHFRYFKFYQGLALVGIAVTDDDPMEKYIIDWYIIHSAEVDTPDGVQNVIDLARTGFLLYNKQ